MRPESANLRLRPFPLFALVLSLSGLMASCTSTERAKPLSVGDVPGAITKTREELLAGRSRDALRRMRRASVTRGLSPDQRSEIESLLEQSGLARIEELRDPPRPGALRTMVKLALPRRIGVRAGIIGAQLYLDKDKRTRAFSLLQRVDQLYPNHNQRREAGRIIADIGFSFAEDPRRYGLFFKYRNQAPRVLEYLVDNYPSEPRTDEAYWTLGELYAEKRLWANAIESLEDLIVWRPDSPRAIESQARIPNLRLRGLASPEYDRYELQRAKGEMEAWLARHAGHPVESEVERDLTDCTQRLADSDLSIARFYRKVDNDQGAAFHARRALEEARSAGNEAQEDEARALLLSIEGAPSETPGETEADGEAQGPASAEADGEGSQP